jgi:hypothetical protein
MEALTSGFKGMIKNYPKFRYKVKEIFGDYYYEEMSVEETSERIFLYPKDDSKVLKNQDEIDQYIRDNLNEKMPLDGPLVRVYL